MKNQRFAELLPSPVRQARGFLFYDQEALRGVQEVSIAEASDLREEGKNANDAMEEGTTRKLGSGLAVSQPTSRESKHLVARRAPDGFVSRSKYSYRTWAFF